MGIGKAGGSKEIEPADFREMKTEYSSKLEKPEAELSIFDQDQVNISDLLDKELNNLLKLDYAYETGEIEKKREVISSMYPEKLTFDGFLFRTNRINEAVRIIYTLDKAFGENKTRQNGNNSTLSCQVGVTGHFSNLFLDDLALINTYLAQFGK